MRINRFKATKVHDYLDFDINFNQDLIFLTGINGSGKTTVVRGISALIAPSLRILANISYREMEVYLDVDGKGVQVGTRRIDNKIIFFCSQAKEQLEFDTFPEELRAPTYRIEEKESDYYNEIEARNASHPVLQFVRSLPTPMFLGIERRSAYPVPGQEGPGRYLTPAQEAYVYHRPRTRARNVFSNILSMSLVEAAVLAELSFRKNQASQNTLKDDLRKDFLLSVFKYEGTKTPRMVYPKLPTKDIEKSKRILRTVSAQLGLPTEKVEAQLDTFFDKLKEISVKIPTRTAFNKIMKESDPAGVEILVEWVVNKPHVDRILQILTRVEKYVEESQKLSEPITYYLETVNQFLGDSEKVLAFDETGELFVTVKGSLKQPITSLSSGESQIVVIITHLAFNPAGQRANVFIVDEPELSLHLKWQELFVQAVQKVNPNLQIILATHSPAIIANFDVDKYCIDLSRKQR